MVFRSVKERQKRREKVNKLAVVKIVKFGGSKEDAEVENEKVTLTIRLEREGANHGMERVFQTE